VAVGRPFPLGKSANVFRALLCERFSCATGLVPVANVFCALRRLFLVPPCCPVANVFRALRRSKIRRSVAVRRPHWMTGTCCTRIHRASDKAVSAAVIVGSRRIAVLSDRSSRVGVTMVEPRSSAMSERAIQTAVAARHRVCSLGSVHGLPLIWRRGVFKNGSPENLSRPCRRDRRTAYRTLAADMPRRVETPTMRTARSVCPTVRGTIDWTTRGLSVSCMLSSSPPCSMRVAATDRFLWSGAPLAEELSPKLLKEPQSMGLGCFAPYAPQPVESSRLRRIAPVEKRPGLS
jgi:hypothetical protein